MADKVPGKAWAVVFCGTAVNLCLGILYAWSVWTKALIDVKKAGQLITEGPAVGWTYLTNAEAATPFSLCVIIFALLMIPGGRIQDKAGPKVGAITGGLFLAVGCIIAGMMKSYAGLVIGFGIFGGIGMGIGYAAPTPAALSWFGPHKRGLIAGLVVGGYGGAALYIGPLASYLIATGGVTSSWIYPGHLLCGGGHHRRLPAGQGASGLCGPGGPGEGGRGPGQGGGHHHRLGPVGNLQDLAVLRPGHHVHRHHPVGVVGHRQRRPDSGHCGQGQPLPDGQRLDPGVLGRPDQRPGPGGHRYVFG